MAQSDIQFDPAITQDEFSKFSRVLAQGLYATPVEPAHARGLLGFDVGVALTAVPVDVDSSSWRHAVGDDFTISDYLAVPRVIASKGLGVATVTAMYAKVHDSDIDMWGAVVDVPVIDGGIVRPTVAVRGAYSKLGGVDSLDLKTYGIEAFISKGFGPITPYAAVGRERSESEGRITATNVLHDRSEKNRITLGAKLSFFIPKLVFEVTQSEERSYAAKVSFGL
jgi:hypothetical protein